MNILLVGSGGREHALAWKISQSPKVDKLFIAPGNAGTSTVGINVPMSATDFPAIREFVLANQVTMVVVGPEDPLVKGIYDFFKNDPQLVSIPVIGPSKEGAQLEGSKDFAKAFMAKYNIPTAGYQTFSDAAEAHAYIDAKGAPIVIKADGLAAGKGVIVAMSDDEAHAAIDDMLVGNKMGDAGARVVIENFLTGEEASFIVMVDGEHVLPMATSQDHKRLLDGDQGPNTGGMGAYSPAPVVTDAVYQRVMDEIIYPTVRGMQAEGHPFSGFLYAGLMINEQGAPFTIEFNCRFGDPETQPIMSRLESDFSELVEAGIDGRLHEVEAKWSAQSAVGVVLAAAGYPESPKKGDVITGTDAANQHGKVFHAGSKLNEQGELLTNGGRVLCVVGLGDDVKHAQAQAYAALENIQFDGMQYRRDIANKAL